MRRSLMIFALLALCAHGCDGCDGAAPVDPGDGAPFVIDPNCTPDGDGDGICDAQEADLGTDPNNPDTDGDGATDAEEVELGTDPLIGDSDDDGILDGDEPAVGTDPNEADEACVGATVEASVGVAAPADIILAIDSSGSMQGEIDAVEANISVNFANIIEASGIDFRVILVADYPPGPKLQICIAEPLSTDDCADPLPAAPGTRFPTFFHYDTLVDSHDAYQVLLNTLVTPDVNGHMPEGWGAVLREEATKTFILITDDAPEGMNHNEFDDALRQAAPGQFDQYVFHSILGMVENSPATAPWQPTDPVQTAQCAPGSENAATDYQELSIETGGLRFPLCANDNFDVVFQEVAAGVIDGVQLPCNLIVPDPPADRELDLRGVAVNYERGDGSGLISLERRDDASACSSNDFFLDGNSAVLCPSTCAEVQADETGALSIFAACVGDLPPDPAGEGEGEGGEGEGEGEQCTECSCDGLACIDGTCQACNATGDCCPGLICINGSCIPPAG